MSNRCAIYARRSTEEHQEASLEVQIQEATRYIHAKGWTLDPEHVFVDDAKSRAEFKRRPGLIALLNAAEEQRFAFVVARDDSRVGGDTYRTGIVLQDLLDHGARLFYYYSDEEVTLDGAVEKFLVAARAFASELEREKTSQRTHEHLMTKARRGLNVGGRVYGYDNVEVHEGERRVRVEYRINDDQADVIREIFRRFAAGEGLRAIAKDLNLRGVPAPRPAPGQLGPWHPSAIREILRRDRYRGLLIWGRREKTYRRGTKVRIPRDPSKWITVTAEHLRIVDDDLWAAAQARRPGKVGAPKGGRPPRYLLSGLAVCGWCGGPISVANAKASRKTVKVYGCNRHRNVGDAVCTNTLRRPVESVNKAVADYVAEHVLSEEIILAALREARRRAADRGRAAADELPQLEGEAGKLRRECARLAELALGAPTGVEGVFYEQLVPRKAQLDALEARVRAARAAPVAIDLELRRMERESRARVSGIQEVLARNPTEARELLAAIFDGPLRFTPVETDRGRRYQIEGTAAPARALGAGSAEELAGGPETGFTNGSNPSEASGGEDAKSLGEKGEDEFTNGASPAGFDRLVNLRFAA